MKEETDTRKEDLSSTGFQENKNKKKEGKYSNYYQ